MSSPLVGLTPPIVGSTKQIIIHLHPTPVLEHYNIQVSKVGLDDKGWGFVLEMMKHAMAPVLESYIRDEVEARVRQQMARPGFLVPGNGERV